MRTGPTSYIHWLEGYDLLGSGSVTELEEYTETHTVQVGLLGERGRFRHSVPLGQLDYMLREKGYVAEDAIALRKIIAENVADGKSVLGYGGARVGALCTIATGITIERRHLTASTEGLSELDVTYHFDAGGEVWEEGFLVKPGTRINGAIAAPFTGHQYDLGTDPPDNMVLCLMVDGINWSGATQLAAQVRTKSTNTGGTGWTNISGNLNITPLTQPGIIFAKVTSGIERYLGLQVTYSGTTTVAIDNSGGYDIGDSTLHVDGRSTTETISVGDSITIGSAAYTVVGGGTDNLASNVAEFDIEVSPALTVAVADNASVTVSNSNTSAKFLVAAAAY